MRHLYADDLLLGDGGRGHIAARGEAMTSQTLTCDHCGRGVPFDNSCSNGQDKESYKGKQSSKDAA